MKILNSHTKQIKSGEWYLTIRSNIKGHENIVFTLRNGLIHLRELANQRAIYQSQTESENKFRIMFQDKSEYLDFLDAAQDLVPIPSCLKDEQPKAISKKRQVKEFKKFVE